MSSKAFAIFEKQSQALRSIAETYDPASSEHASIQLASFALLYALTKHFDDFQAFMHEYGSSLTKEQKDHLAELGLKSE